MRLSLSRSNRPNCVYACRRQPWYSLATSLLLPNERALQCRNGRTASLISSRCSSVNCLRCSWPSRSSRSSRSRSAARELSRGAEGPPGAEAPNAVALPRSTPRLPSEGKFRGKAEDDAIGVSALNGLLMLVGGEEHCYGGVVNSGVLTRNGRGKLAGLECEQ